MPSIFVIIFNISFSIKHLYQGIDYLFSLKNDKFFIEAGPGATLTEIDGDLFSDS
jgi:hypothetical protein